MGSNSSAKLGQKVLEILPSAPTGTIAVGIAKQYIIESKLWTPGGKTKGKEGRQGNAFPKRTLVKRDLEGEQLMGLPVRAKAVALALGDTVARGRIGSLGMMREEVTTFEQWWAVATNKMKSRLVSDQRIHKEFSEEEHAAIARALSPCPFRGTVPSPKEEEPHEEEEEAEGGAAA